MRHPQQVKLKYHILKKVKSGSIPEKENIIALISRSLANHGTDKDSIHLVLSDVQFHTVINPETS